MKLNNCFIYPKTVRESIEGVRHYDVGKEKLPSVTTILKATESEEKKTIISELGSADRGGSCREGRIGGCGARNGDAQDS